MKKRIFLFLALSMLVVLTGCTAKSTNPQSANTPQVTEAAKATPVSNPVIVQKLLDAIGPELIERGKAAELNLTISYSEYAYEPDEGWTPKESDNTEDTYMLSVSMRSAIGSTGPEAFTVDVETMKEILYAVIDSGVFNLTEEGAATLKEHHYSQKNRYEDMFVPDVNGRRVTLNIDETPSGYEAICSIGLNKMNEDFSKVITDGHVKKNSYFYKWDELQQ